METRTETITAHDGGKFTGYLAVPDSGSGPGMVVIQEIFGITRYIKEATERVARLGYVALAPDLYWRIQPGVALDERDPDALQSAFGYMGRLDFKQAVDDARATLENLRGLPEVRGGAGILGFCLGGGVSYLVAATGDPDTCVSYYGSAVPDALDAAGQVSCPILFHFGGADDYIPEAKRASVEQAFAGRRAEFHVHAGAGHAFDNWNSAVFYNEAAARESWPQTVDFLRRTLPAG